MLTSKPPEGLLGYLPDPKGRQITGLGLQKPAKRPVVGPEDDPDGLPTEPPEDPENPKAR